MITKESNDCEPTPRWHRAATPLRDLLAPSALASRRSLHRLWRPKRTRARHSTCGGARSTPQRWAQSTGRVSGLDATANPWWTDGTSQCKYAATWRAGHSTEAIATTPARPFERDDNT